jgi:heme/copper-type cytochrome/quinol oxidase subunit 2
MIKKITFGFMWFVIIFLVVYVVTGATFVFFIVDAETNQVRYEAAQTFRNTYMVFFAIGSLILAILGTVSGILPGTKKKPQKKSSAKKKVHKKK